MARPYPLQDGDYSSNYGDTDRSTSADRRQDRENPIQPEQGVNPAPQREAPYGDLWRPGQLAPNNFLSAPFNAVASDDLSEADQVRELNIGSYGDCYDPTSYARTHQAPLIDPDHDGE